MSPRVALVAVDATGPGAVGSRIDGFHSGLTRRGWTVEVIDIPRLPPSRIQPLVDQAPRAILGLIEAAGIEGDVMPRTGYRARRNLVPLDADVAVVSVPPFSLLPAASCWLPAHIPLVIDYRDPWAARHAPPALAHLTRPIERHAMQRAHAVTYAGHQRLENLLVRRLGIPKRKLTAVPNGYDPQDLLGLQPTAASAKNGASLSLVYVGYWYGRNGPGLLPQALAITGPQVVELTVIGGISPPIVERFTNTLSHPPKQLGPISRHQVYQHLAKADLAVVTLDHTSAIESRVPAKTYDYLAVGTPVLAICPPEAAILQVPGAERFHHTHHRDLDQLVNFLRKAAKDRTILRPGPTGTGPTRDRTAEILHHVLHQVT